MRVQDLQSIRIKIASPEEILKWSHGEVVKPETINYRTQKAEKDGLFCEKIFGPEKDYQCYCGKYRKIRYKGIICDRCGVEITTSSVRRERMGHIKLACPVSHIWFLRGLPSIMAIILSKPMQQLEKVIYFASYIIIEVDEAAKKIVLGEIESEFKIKQKTKNTEVKNKKELKNDLDDLKQAKDRAREEVLSLSPLKILSEIDFHNLSLKYGEVFKAGTGAETLRKVFSEIDLKKEISALKKKIEGNIDNDLVGEKRNNLRRLKLMESMFKTKIQPEWMFLTVLPVLPPDLRPMVQLDGGRYASSDLNDLYRRVINRNNRLKYLLDIFSPDVIVRNEKRLLQEAVDALIDNGMRKGQMTQATTGGKRLLKSLADILKGKQGRFRANLLGKRVDYSGRSVIVVGPNLKMSECALPKKMALELFKPFVIKKILDKELAYNVRGASRLIDTETPEVWASLEEVVKDKVVMLNRAPTLHRLGIQAFKPLLIEEDVIRLHPLVCSAFNADFDGDTMAVYLPLSNKAQEEAKKLVLSGKNLLKPATGEPVITPTQDIVLGCYWITKIKENALGKNKIFGSKNEAILAKDTGVIDLRAKIKVRMNDVLIETTVGRILLNNALPKEYPFQNLEVDSRKLKSIISDFIRIFDNEIANKSLDKIKKLGFEYSTISGITWGMDDLIVPEEKKDFISSAEKEIEKIDGYYQKGLLSREEKKEKAIEVWERTKLKIEELVPKTLPPLGPVFSIISSGARGSWSQPVQMTGMKGLVINPAGQIIELPIKSSYKEGFDVLEYFISTHGARKGTVDTALRTSTAGYLTRRLIDVAHEIIVTEEDCKDKEGLVVFREDSEKIGQEFRFKIVGRISLDEIKGKKSEIIVKKGEIIDWKKAKKITDLGIEEVRIRSLLTCKSSRGACQKCYGWDMGNNELVKLGSAVGIIAAQAIGEPGTQLTMRTFHVGGVAGGRDITQGLPRVQEIFENRVPGGKALISKTDGIVKEITKDRIINIETKGKGFKTEIIEYKIPLKTAILVEKGQEIEKGEQLCEGSVDLKELYKVRGLKYTQFHILNEVQGIYNSQGVGIHDKHFEAIIKQMFSRVRIKDPGDTSFSSGEVVERLIVAEKNKKVSKKATFKELLLGISKVALTTDSFLSAASFQETSRVLIKAAIEGKEDRLRGLKENVIIGKLIPAGTGFKK